jgi:hypothetical protein
VLLKGDGYAVDLNDRPITVRENGHVVATVGQTVRLGGGLTADEGRVQGCPVGAARDPWVGAFVEAPQSASTPTTQDTHADASRRTLINWPDGAAAYEQGHAAVFACAVDGTKSTGSMDSYPPILAFLSVSEAAKRAFQSCALAVPGTGLYVPG